MTTRVYQHEVARTTAEDLTPAQALCMIGLGLTGEAGEVADMLKKHVFHGHALDKESLLLEMGDVLWYLAALCNALDMTLVEVMAANVVKLRARYPDGWDEQRSQERAIADAGGDA